MQCKPGDLWITESENMYVSFDEEISHFAHSIGEGETFVIIEITSHSSLEVLTSRGIRYIRSSELL